VKCEEGRGMSEGQPFLLFSFSCIYRSKDIRSLSRKKYRIGVSENPQAL
jgi:hypothetical protein